MLPSVSPSEAPATADATFMRRALELAPLGWGRVHPNPLVGAVVVRDGAVVGTGAHREYGGPHAEIEALAAAGGAARGATLYVTLEPCSHQGKTPPCTDAILGAGVTRVVYAAADPHREAGGGAARLRSAGVEVLGGVEADAARVQNALFLGPLEGRDPFVALKLAVSLDARLGRSGERTRVTGEASEAAVHRLRAGFDAILVGAATAETDDPLLTVRHAAEPRKPPVRLVADTAARLAPDSRLARTAGDVPTWVLTGREAPAARVEALERVGVRVVRGPVRDDRLDLPRALERLAAEGIHTVLCEGGGRLGAALLAHGLVDRLYLFMAPVLFGADGVEAFPGLQPAGAEPIPDRVVDVRRLGRDVLMTLDRSG